MPQKYCYTEAVVKTFATVIVFLLLLCLNSAWAADYSTETIIEENKKCSCLNDEDISGVSIKILKGHKVQQKAGGPGGTVKSNAVCKFNTPTGNTCFTLLMEMCKLILIKQQDGTYILSCTTP
jgi:hypothetical protein